MKQKSFIQTMSWAWGLLLGMGLIFLGIGIAVQVMPMDPSSVTVTVNGVRQPSTPETVRMFRLIFLCTFGLFGLIMTLIGGVILWRGVAKKQRDRRLKMDGICLTATVTDYMPSNLHVGGRQMTHLSCAHTGSDGRTYIFKSGMLRMDPTPFLRDGKVKVYCDRDDMRKYFVDVDGSVGLGYDIVAL